MKDITTEEAVAVLAEFKKTGYHLMLCKYEGSRQRTNRSIEQAIEKVLNELERYKELYISTLGHTLNNSIAQSIKANEDLEVLNEGWKIELEKKDKIINAMALQLSGISIWDNQKQEPLILMTEEAVKEYYERMITDGESNNKKTS